MNNYLFVVLIICHWAGDFTHLSTPTILAAKRFGKPLFPIFNHACMHAALMTFPIMFAFQPNVNVIFLAVGIELVSHFLIDVWKGKMNYWFPYFQDNTKYPYWYLFGIDQILHILIILLICNL